MDSQMIRADALSVGDVIDWRGAPAEVLSVEIGRTVEIVVHVVAESMPPFRITFPTLTAEEWNAEWTDEDFAARREADLAAEQFTLIET
jgi:hypothetical protein